MKRILLTLFAWTIFIVVQAQTTVTGTVTDGPDGSPLPGVSVVIKNSQRGSVTDADGKFSINAAPDDVLVFSFIGFEAKEESVNNRSVITIALAPSVQELSEVVVIGYGERERKDLTGAVSSMKTEEISKSVYASPELAMQGRMAGVFVSSPGGNPNARPNVQIRGLGTFNNANPLYVVDGIPLFEFGGGSTDGAVGDLRGNVNILNLINPGDIESISVLKDAAASAIYGSRAANGVILITTKKGKKGTPRIEFNASRGVQNLPKKYDVLNTQQFTQIYQEMFDNDTEYRRQHAPSADPAAPYTWNQFNYLNVFNPGSTDPYYKYLGNSPTYDWQNELINKDASIEDYSVRVSGGSDMSTYYIGAGYSKTESPLIQNNLERYSISANVDTKISKYISTGVLYRVTYMESLDNTNGDLAGVSRVSPWQPIYDANDPTGYARTTDVSFEDNPDFDLSKADAGAAKNFVSGSDQLRPWGNESSSNFFAQMHYNRTDYSLLKNFGNAFLQVEPLKGLKLKGSIGVDWTYNRRNQFQNPFETVRFSETPSNPYGGNDGTSKATYEERHARNINFMKDLTLTYTRSFGDHKFELLANASQQDLRWEVITGGSPQQYSDYSFRGVGGNQRWNNGFTSRDNKAIQGYVGRLSYNYRDKYYVDASVRRDGSSEFAPAYRWGTFPALAVAWRISEESFAKNSIGFFDDLKLRAGYGVLGNSFSNDQGYARFAYLSKVSTSANVAFGSGNGNAIGSQTPAAFLPNFPNSAITWEKAKTLNIGLDGGLLGSQLTFTIEYYNKLTEGIIQQVELPANAGIAGTTDFNVANVRNSGIELQLGYTKQVGAVQLFANANLTTVRNRVEKLYQGVPLIGGFNTIIQEGQSINSWYGYKVGGILQSDAEADAWNDVYDNANGSNPRPGDMYFQDLYGNPKTGEKFKSLTVDSVINSNDRTVLGKQIPGFYYGLNLGARAKGFDLSVFFQGVGDVKKYNGVRNSGEQMSGNGLNFWNSTLNRWTPENPSTSMPRAIYGDPAENGRMSDRWIESASFLRLKNVQLGYSINPQALAATKSLTSFRVYVSGTNLFTATKWTGLDPENDLNPPTRIWSLGVNATF